ncbi:uncharacterized protein [Haliotis asinina]|uniref:uncharacterized protein n=1 Tax=Haliotis asinina TaxID=109174 RepID=UPI00353251E5
MAPSLILVLLVIAAARAAINTPKDVVRFVKSNCVSIGIVAQETCTYCERACRPVLELGEFCEDFCEGGRTAQCDILGKFRPGDAARYNNTAESYCKTNEITDVCRILRSLRDAALLLESGNPCITGSAASAERDDTSKDKDVCAKLLKDSKDLILCHPSDTANAKSNTGNTKDNTKDNTANTKDNTANTNGKAPRVNGRVPLGGGPRGRAGGVLRRRREAPARVPVSGIQTESTCQESGGTCKELCANLTEARTFHTCQSGTSCCFGMLGASRLQELGENRIPNIDTDIPMRNPFPKVGSECDGRCSSSCRDEEMEVPMYTCDGPGLKCCYEVLHCNGSCKESCTPGTEVVSWLHCKSGQQCCLQNIL